MTAIDAPSDPRSTRTRAAIVGAFRDLVLAGRYDRLKINEIARHAGVARSTFYEHYATKDELLGIGLHAPIAALADAGFTDALPPELAGWLDHFRDHRRTAGFIFNGPARRTVTQALALAIEARLVDEHPALPAHLLAQQVAHGQIALLAAWLAGRGGGSAGDVADLLHRSARGALVALTDQASAASAT
jgi:AcrR family transcriptional regulator